MYQQLFPDACSWIWGRLVRYRFQIWDFSVMAVAFATAVFLAGEYQLLRLIGVSKQAAKDVELGEILLIAAGLAVSLFVTIRRSRTQAREMARRIRAEAEARQLALHDPLTGFLLRMK